MPDDRRKAAASGAASRAHNGGEAWGRDIGKGARLRTVGDIGGGRERQEQERKRGRHDEAKRFGVA